MTISVPALYAMSHGIPPQGDKVCAFCGAKCISSYAAKAYRDKVKVNAGQVVSAGQGDSEHCCIGCFMSFREKTTLFIPPIPPETKPVREDAMAVSAYSWFLTEKEAVPYDQTNPTYRKMLRERLLDPLKTKPQMWAAILTATRKDDVFWRGRVNDLAAPPFTVLLVTPHHDPKKASESTLINYKPNELRDRLNMVGKMQAVMSQVQTMDQFYGTFVDRYDHGEEMLEEWKMAKVEPLSKLADFLCWAPDECNGLFPPDRKSKVAPKPSLAEIGGDKT